MRSPGKMDTHSRPREELAEGCNWFIPEGLGSRFFAGAAFSHAVAGECQVLSVVEQPVRMASASVGSPMATARERAEPISNG